GVAVPRFLGHLVHHVAVDELDPAGVFQRPRRDDPLILVDGDPVERRRPGWWQRCALPSSRCDRRHGVALLPFDPPLALAALTTIVFDPAEARKSGRWRRPELIAVKPPGGKGETGKSRGGASPEQEPSRQRIFSKLKRYGPLFAPVPLFAPAAIA